MPISCSLVLDKTLKGIRGMQIDNQNGFFVHLYLRLNIFNVFFVVQKTLRSKQLYKCFYVKLYYINFLFTEKFCIKRSIL